MVQLQFRIAGQEPHSLPSQSAITINRHAIECRLNAEDPFNNFMPSPGVIQHWYAPSGAGVRVDSHCRDGYLVPPYYDSMIGKLVITANDRNSAVQRLSTALEDFKIEGLVTNIPLLRAIVGHKDFRENSFNTKWLEKSMLPEFEQTQKEE